MGLLLHVNSSLTETQNQFETQLTFYFNPAISAGIKLSLKTIRNWFFNFVSDHLSNLYVSLMNR